MVHRAEVVWFRPSSLKSKSRYPNRFGKPHRSFQTVPENPREVCKSMLPSELHLLSTTNTLQPWLQHLFKFKWVCQSENWVYRMRTMMLHHEILGGSHVFQPKSRLGRLIPEDVRGVKNIGVQIHIAPETLNTSATQHE